ncbi:MAG: TonB-dependent receptor, partial [Aquificota bacterium]
QFYYTKVDHWMDNRYRVSSGTMPWSMATDAKTKTFGGRLEGNLGDFTLGFEAYRRNWDATNYMGMNPPQYIIPDVDTSSFGVYGEYRKRLLEKLRIVAGLRLDTTKTEADSSKANTNLYYAYKNTRATSKTDTYPSGNLQVFYELSKGTELFAGIGHTARVPDPQERYFALNRAMMCNNNNPFCAWVGNPNLKPSKNTEIDLGLKHSTGRLITKATLFYSYVQDYITVHRQNVQNPGMMAPAFGHARSYTNVDAQFYGFEASFNYNAYKNLFVFGGSSYTVGRKDTDPAKNITDKDVAEIPPLKARLGLRYDTGLWFVEGETLMSGTQDRVDRDLQEQKTSGWAIVNLKAGAEWKDLRLVVGVDNVFDKKYYEHLSYQRDPFRSGVKVPEPGRNFYASLSYQF